LGARGGGGARTCVVVQLGWRKDDRKAPSEVGSREAHEEESNQSVHIGAAQWTHFNERCALLRRDD